MLLQTNSYVVRQDRRAEHARLMRRFRQALARLGCEDFEVYEQVGNDWSGAETTGPVRYVQLMRFRDRKHQQSVQKSERTDPLAQSLINEFIELVDFPYQQQQGLFVVGFFGGVLPNVSARPSSQRNDVIDSPPALSAAPATDGDEPGAEEAQPADAYAGPPGEQPPAELDAAPAGELDAATGTDALSGEVLADELTFDTLGDASEDALGNAPAQLPARLPHQPVSQPADNVSNIQDAGFDLLGEMHDAGDAGQPGAHLPQFNDPAGAGGVINSEGDREGSAFVSGEGVGEDLEGAGLELEGLEFGDDSLDGELLDDDIFLDPPAPTLNGPAASSNGDPNKPARPAARPEPRPAGQPNVPPPERRR